MAPDHLGCGLSDRPANFDYCLASHVSNLRRLINELDLKDATLVAQDWGGPIGLGALLSCTERFRRIVLLNTGAFRSRRMPWRIAVCRFPWLGTLAVRGLNAFSLAALRMAVAHPRCLKPQVRAGYLYPYDSWGHRIAVDRFVKDIPMNSRHRSWPELVAIEHGLVRLRPLPALLVWGMKDWCFTPYFLDRFMELLPQAEVERIESAGHWVLEDAEERVIRRIERFLDEQA